MKFLRAALLLLLFSIPLVATGAVRSGDFPAGTVWYVHADLEQMRSSDSGGPLYAWLDGEVFLELRDEIGVDINKETDSVTAFSKPGTGTVVLIKGRISKEAQQKLLDVARSEGRLETRKHGKKTYYLSGDGRESHSDGSDPFDSLQESTFFSFAVNGKLLVASNEDQLKALIDSNGKISGSKSHEGALFVLSADKTFMQAGLKTDQFAEDDDDWDSKIIRNTEQAALMLSDADGMIAVEAQLVSTDARLAQSIGGIVNGLVSLQAFNDDLDPEIRTLIQNTRIEVDEKVLTISTVIDPDIALAVIDD